MKIKYLLLAFALSLCANANAEWFLRGTHNAWVSTQMQAGGTNTMQLNGVVFTAAGSIKFDRFGDWKESYGVGGLGGSNIPVAAGTWDIKFFTNTKTWSITAPQVAATYHIRGTFNGWVEGTLMTRLGTTNTYESCINFVGGDANGGPRFKIDPNGGWGDGIPAADVVVAAGWVKVSFDSQSKAISTQQNLAANCGVAASSSVAVSSSAVSLSSAKSSVISSSSAVAISSSSVKSSSVAVSSSSKSSVASSIAVSSVAVSSAAPSSIYHVRGTFNGWAEGTLMTRIGTTDSYEKCVNFFGGDANGGPRFKIDPNGGWGDAIPATDFIIKDGWVKITFNSVTKVVSAQPNFSANCLLPSSVASSAIASSSAASAPSSIYHVRGTFNGWAEGTLMTRIGTTDSYEKCVNFVGGDTNGGPRFKIDPNGAWGDGIPAADFVVTAGWVKITFNSVTKAISVQQNLAANCATASSVAASSVATSSVAASSVASTPSSIYHVRGTFNGWVEGTLMTRVGNTDIYEKCIRFPADPLGAKFKIDPNGAWGADVLPSPTAPDIGVTAGWVKITLNSTTKAISLQQNLSLECTPVNASQLSRFSYEAPKYNLRSSIDGWGEGIVMTQPGPDAYFLREACIDVTGTRQFRISLRENNGMEGFTKVTDFFDNNLETTFSVTLSGVSYIEYHILSGEVEIQTNLAANCAFPTFGGGINFTPMSAFPTTLQPAKPFIPVHIRGTQNAWAEGTLMKQVGTTDDYEACVNIPEGDANGGPRFKLDPNGGWVDETPDSNVPAGWVKIRYNTTTKKITRRTSLSANCLMRTYALAGTHHRDISGMHSSWLKDDFFEFVDGDAPAWKICRNFTEGDEFNGPRLHIVYDNMGGSGQSEPIGPLVTAVNGWTFVSFTDVDNPTIITNMGPNCTAP